MKKNNSNNDQNNQNNQNQEDKMNKKDQQSRENKKDQQNQENQENKKSTSRKNNQTNNKSSSTPDNTASIDKTLFLKLLDPSEVGVPGRTNADDYKSAVGKFKVLSSTSIIAASKYLHQPTALEVEEIIKHFDARLVEPLKVVRKGSMYELIDGVKTYTALRELHKRLGVSSFDVLCRIYPKLTEEDCARMYAKQDEQHTKLPLGYKIRALEVAQDPEVLEFLEKTREAGFETRPGDHRPRNGYIAAVGTAFKVFQNIGAQAYLHMLKIVHKTWAGEKWSVTKHMLAGMSQFLKTHNVDIDSFSRMFRHVTYEEIVAKALDFKGMTRDGAFASAIADKFVELTAMAQNANAVASN